MSNGSFDILAAVTCPCLNDTIARIYSKVKEHLKGEIRIDTGLTIEWCVNRRPSVDLSVNGCAFAVTAGLKFTSKPEDGPQSSAEGELSIGCSVSMAQNGRLDFIADSVTASSADQLVNTGLTVFHDEILRSIQNMLNCIHIPLGTFEGITFTAYTAGIRANALMAGAGIDGKAVVLPDASPVATGFGISVTGKLLKKFMDEHFWANLPKQYSFSPAVLNVTGYALTLNGGITLDISVSGEVSVSVKKLISLKARWTISLSPRASIQASVSQNKVQLTTSAVSIPKFKIEPQDWVAKLFSFTSKLFGLDDQIKAGVTALLRKKLEEELPKHAIDVAKATTTLFDVPITVSPRDVKIAVGPGAFFISGDIGVE